MPLWFLEELSGLDFKEIMEIFSTFSWDDKLPNSRSLLPCNKDFSTSEQSLRGSFPQLLSNMTLDDAVAVAACYCLPTDKVSKRIHFSFLREQRESHCSRIQSVCVTRRSNGGHVAELGIEIVSPWRKGTLIDVCWLEISMGFLGS